MEANAMPRRKDPMRVQVERILKGLGAEGQLSMHAINQAVRDVYDVGESEVRLPDGRVVRFWYSAVRGHLLYALKSSSRR